jgi:acetolactate synthase-1/2/3 large subunit
MNGSHAVMRALLDQGVTVIFGYPGGAIMPIYDALYDYRDRVHHVLVRHEQAAAHAAEGYARITGKVGVCFATSGPGATNLVTGIADAMADSIPIVCITGQVASGLLGTDAFQEVDIIGVTTPITKWNYQITDGAEIPEIIAKAFHIAHHGRPGPVLIDITKDAQSAMFDYLPPRPLHIPGFNPTLIPNQHQIGTAAELLNNAKYPFIIAGHGIMISKATGELRTFIEKGGFPVAVTLHGISSIPVSHPQYVGWLGMHGNYGTNVLTNKADVICAIGMRFDDRVTGRLKDYAPHAKIIHIDIDPAELNKNVRANIPIVADTKEALKALIPHIKPKKHKAWITQFRKHYETEFEKVIRHEINPKSAKIHMAECVKLVSDITKGKAVIVTDVGQHQMKTARYYAFDTVDSFITSGGMGTMGFALPAAIGAKKGTDRPVIAIIGDGSFQMNIQELATLAQEKLPVKVIILNNSFLGMVRQWQELFFEKRYSFTTLANPDFVAVTRGFGVTSTKVSNRNDLAQAIQTLLAHKGPYVLEVVVALEENVFPMMPSGASVEEMRLE